METYMEKIYNLWNVLYKLSINSF